MQYVEFIVTRPTTGAALPGAKVTVYLAGTTTPATLYNAAGGGISNPATADASGLIGFAAANGSYDFSAASADGSYVVPTIHRQQFYDLSGLDAQVTLAQAAAAAAAAAAPFLVVSATSLAGALANTTSGQQAAVQQSQGYATDLYVRSTTGLQYLSTTPTGLGVLTTQRIANLGFSQFATQAPSTSLVFGQAILAKFADGRLTPPAPTTFMRGSTKQTMVEAALRSRAITRRLGVRLTTESSFRRPAIWPISRLSLLVVPRSLYMHGAIPGRAIKTALSQKMGTRHRGH
jgi:hypothetical protein